MRQENGRPSLNTAVQNYPGLAQWLSTHHSFSNYLSKRQDRALCCVLGMQRWRAGQLGPISRRPWAQTSMTHRGGTQPHFGCCRREAAWKHSSSGVQRTPLPARAVWPAHQRGQHRGQHSPVSSQGREQRLNSLVPQGHVQGGKETGHVPWHHSLGTWSAPGLLYKDHQGSLFPE